MEQHIVMQLREQIVSARALQEMGREIESRASQLIEIIQAIDLLNPQLLDSNRPLPSDRSPVSEEPVTPVSNMITHVGIRELSQQTGHVGAVHAIGNTCLVSTPLNRTPRRHRSRYVWTPEQTERVVQMRSNGVSLDQIAREFGRTKEQIRDHWRYAVGKKK